MINTKRNRVFLLVIFVVLLCTISYGKALDYNFWRDDWTALWLWKFHTYEYFTNWTFSSRHPGEFLNLFPQVLLFNTNHYLWQGLGLLLKIGASFSVGLASYGFTRSKKIAIIASLLYASYFGGIEAFTWLSAHLSADLIILICLSFYFYTESFRKNNKKLFISFLFLLFVSTIIEPTRILFTLPLFIIWEFSERYMNQQFIIKKMSIRVFYLLVSFLGGLLITPFGRTLVMLHGSSGYSQAIIKNLTTMQTFFSTLGNLLLPYFDYFVYSDVLKAFIAANTGLIGLFSLLCLIALSLRLIIRKNSKGVFILLSALWIPCLYFPSWLAETDLTVDPFHRYVALSGVGFIFILAYFVSKLGKNSMIFVCLTIICMNLYQSIITVYDTYKIRGYPITQKLYDTQESQVPANFTGGLFWVEGNSGLRGSAFDYSLGGTIPFALQRNIGRLDLVPARGIDIDTTQKLLCKKNVFRPTITTWILQKNQIPLSKVYAWRVMYDGTLKNITNTFRATLIKSTPCLQDVHGK